jgi:hypothetical protein
MTTKAKFMKLVFFMVQAVVFTLMVAINFMLSPTYISSWVILLLFIEWMRLHINELERQGVINE